MYVEIRFLKIIKIRDIIRERNTTQVKYLSSKYCVTRRFVKSVLVSNNTELLIKINYIKINSELNQ
jgi:hypothetical protein